MTWRDALFLKQFINISKEMTRHLLVCRKARKPRQLTEHLLGLNLKQIIPNDYYQHHLTTLYLLLYQLSNSSSTI